MRSKRIWPNWILPLLLILVSFGLRLHRISAQSIWWDEAFSVHLAQVDVWQAIQLTRADIHPPAYYVLLHYWGLLGGFSELSVRFLSLLFDVTLVCAVYAWVRRMFDQQTGLLAMAIVCLSPLQVVYSQEARMYTLLSLQYVILLYVLWRLTTSERHTPSYLWGVLLLAELTSLYTHYFSAMIIVYVNLFFIGWCVIRRNMAYLRNWLVTQLAALLLYLPWLPTALNQATHYTTVQTKPPHLWSFAAMIWRFYMIGFSDLPGDASLLATLASVTAILFIAATLLLLTRKGSRTPDLTLLSHCLGPLALVFVVWQVSPAVHPRYTIMLAVPFYALLARCVASPYHGGQRRAMVGVLLACALLATSVAGVAQASSNPSLAKDDVRSLAGYLEAHSRSDDVIIVDWKDYSPTYYYQGPATLEMSEAGDLEQALPFLQRVTAGRQRAILVHRYGATDLRGMFSFALEQIGRLVETASFAGYSARIYQLEGLPRPLQMQSVFADFGVVQLTGAFYEGTASADNAVCVALRWRCAEQTMSAYKATVVLRDMRGRRVSSADLPLLNRQLEYTTSWTAGEETINYYVVPVPIGTPPLSYSLGVAVYDAATLTALDVLDQAKAPVGRLFSLSTVQLRQAGGWTADPYRTQESLRLVPLSETFDDGLMLEGMAVDKEIVSPGQALSIILSWRAMQDHPAFEGFQLLVKQGDQVIAETAGDPAAGQYPAQLWRSGELVLDRREVIIDPRANEGAAALIVEVNGKSKRIVEITVSGMAHSFIPPAAEYEVYVRFGDFAELIGYDLSSTDVNTRDGLKLTLYWRAAEGAPTQVPYTCFAHILREDGTLVGQHDGPPVSGLRPTTSWLKGEILVDVHELQFRELTYRGTGRIEVGLYDASTIERAKTDQGLDFFMLPSTILVRP